ncbi:2-phosphosulfolactate phosphatase [Marivirga arenosa]|uniref:Probable 2-phosphosulfolactate phosphatase n=1 Tax=Marivirga arenosa TaxID=3059076 RepID=A0AA51N7U2_9BACT|nr:MULTISPECIES: 2-phosphosulfolactate phosphatase [unclassified Marivirga]WMN07603.1 2-phosphosulfolactate phosphatase [Marivirga sp. ABR2-2]WNB18194.1 2-phosphosulfolactate phosphatase [Marivirga sp. BKB1-2]
MKNIDVCLTPELLHQYNLENKIVVVVDILRATSCMVSGFSNGVTEIIPVSTLEECKALQEKGYLAAAERNGSKAEGFDLGNSPFEYLDSKMKGEKVAVTTTNGTLAINKSLAAKEILIGAFLNLNALVEYLKNKEEDIIILCAGWKGKFNLEDTLFAGALAHQLKEDFQFACDAPLAAEAMYLTAKKDMMNYMRDSSHAKRLSKLNVVKDIEFCVQESIYDIIPYLDGKSLRLKK